MAPLVSDGRSEHIAVTRIIIIVIVIINSRHASAGGRLHSYMYYIYKVVMIHTSYMHACI